MVSAVRMAIPNSFLFVFIDRPLSNVKINKNEKRMQAGTSVEEILEKENDGILHTGSASAWRLFRRRALAKEWLRRSGLRPA